MLVAAATLVVGLQVALAREVSQAATTWAAAILRAVVRTPAVAILVEATAAWVALGVPKTTVCHSITAVRTNIPHSIWEAQWAASSMVVTWVARWAASMVQATSATTCPAMMASIQLKWAARWAAKWDKGRWVTGRLVHMLVVMIKATGKARVHLAGLVVQVAEALQVAMVTWVVTVVAVASKATKVAKAMVVTVASLAAKGARKAKARESKAEVEAAMAKT